MAIETDHFKRDDIYTLFITTRIINFLKGLRFKENQINLDKALGVARNSDKRSAIGAELIERLFADQCLYAYMKDGFKLLPRFNFLLFSRIWSEVNQIATQEGNVIIPPFYAQESAPKETPRHFPRSGT